MSEPHAPKQISPWEQAGAFLWASAGVLAASTAAFALHRLMPHANLSLVFLTGVLVVASRWGLAPALFAAIISFFVFNFLFTPPYHTFAVDSEEDVASLLFFLVVAALTGQLAARMHDHIALNRAAVKRISTLYGFAKRMAAAASTDQVLRELTKNLNEALGCPVAALLPDREGHLELRAGAPAGTSAPAHLDRLDAAWQTDTSPPPRQGFVTYTLGTSRGPVGLIVVQQNIHTPDQEEQVRALCDQAAIAIERTELVADLEGARLATETEQLRSALLSSVSHDLRTPLSSIIGSSSTLLEYWESIGEDDRRELLTTVRGEAERLDRYIQNLLDMTRLGQGGLALHRDWVALEDVVGTALERLAAELAGFDVRVDIAPDLPLAYVHGVFLEQALVNLLDNAVHFSPPQGTIRIAVRREADRFTIDVIDQGPGIPEAERERVFDMFYSIAGGDRRPQGTGLGLAICRGLCGAHGGDVTASAGPGDVGTCMRITLPVQTPGAPHDEPDERVLPA